MKHQRGGKYDQLKDITVKKVHIRIKHRIQAIRGAIVIIILKAIKEGQGVRGARISRMVKMEETGEVCSD